MILLVLKYHLYLLKILLNFFRLHLLAHYLQRLLHRLHRQLLLTVFFLYNL